LGIFDNMQDIHRNAGLNAVGCNYCFLVAMGYSFIAGGFESRSKEYLSDFLVS